MNRNNQEIGVAIIGGGQGCLELLQLFEHFPLEEFKANILGVADRNLDAPGIKYAGEKGKAITDNFREFYSHPEIELLIELTGDNNLLQNINQSKPARIKVIDHVGARLFWDLMRLKADKRARTILESTTDAFLTINAGGKIMQYNQAAQKMFARAFFLKPAVNLVGEVFGLEGVKILHQRKAGKHKLTAYRGRKREFPAEVNVIPVEIEEEDCLVLSIRDVSEGFQAQQEISRLHRYEALYNNITSSFALSRDLEQSIYYSLREVGETLGADGVTLRYICSKTNSLILKGYWQAPGIVRRGYSPSISFQQMPFITDHVKNGNMIKLYNVDLLPDADRSMLANNMVKSLLGLPIEGQKGAWGALFVETRSPKFWSQEEAELLLTIANIMQNAIQQQEVQESLQESEALYQVMVDRSLTGIYIIQDGLLTFVNNRMAEIFDYSIEELVGMNPVDLTNYPDQNLVFDRLKEKNPTTIQYVFRGRKKSGEIVWLETLDSVITIKGKQSIVGNMMDVSERMENEEIRNRMFEAITMLAVNMVEQRDPYTAGHQRRVAEICVAIGKKMGLSSFELEGLRLAALLHDIGKFAIPIEILTKPGKLRPSEMQFIELHSQVGAELLANVPFPWDISSMVMQHHERLDGSGYPAHLRGAEIKMGARIIAVADVLEAMSSHRPYRPALGIELAMQELIEHQGRYYDPMVVAALQEIIHDLEL